MSKIYGAGIIGAGVIFRDHAKAYKELESRIRLIGLADVDEVKLSRSGGGFFIPYTTTDYHQLIAREDVDVVSICTPPYLHESMIRDCLEAGKYVVCEKPLAHTLAETDRICELAAKFPGKLSTVYQLRYADNAQQTIWCRDEGLLGELAFGHFHRRVNLDAQKIKGWWGKWQVAGGGAVMTQSIHELDLILQFFGPIRRVSAAMATRGHSIESEDTFSATMEHESGAITTCSCSVASNVKMHLSWDVLGTKGAMHQTGKIESNDPGYLAQANRQLGRRFPSILQRNRLKNLLGKVFRKVKQKIKKSRAGGPSIHTPYLRDVLDAIDAGQPLPIGADEARQSVELCTAIYTSAITNQSVDLPLDNTCPFYNGITTDDYNGQS